MIFLAGVALSVLAYGSVGAAPIDLAAFSFALLAGISVFRPIGSVAVGRLHAATTILLAALLSYAILQALPIAGLWPNEAWSSVEDLVGPVQKTISVAPGLTAEALPKLALPFLVFLSALSLFQSDADAFTLWRALAYFGACYAVFGILQDQFAQDSLLFTRKTFYLGYLTASFVNRNTAGTFFGLALLLNLGLLFYHLRQIRVGGFAKKVISLDLVWRDENSLVLLHGLLCVIVAVALFLTQSRGAVGASFVAAIVGVAVMMTRRVTNDGRGERAGAWNRHARILAGVFVVVGLFALFAGRSTYRMEEQGPEDARWCAFASTFEAIRDHPLSGTGLGAFQDVFPAYRNAECSGIRGVWDHAHDFFLEGYLGLGVPFAFVLLVGYGILIGVCVRGLRRRQKFRFVPAMGLTALILVSLHSIVDFSLQIPGVAVYFAAAMASTMTVSLGRS